VSLFGWAGCSLTAYGAYRSPEGRVIGVKGKYLKGKTIEYDGSQLSPHWAFTNVDLKGDSIVSFRGPCSVEKRYMVDIEDQKENAIIKSPDMLHFLVEFFGCDVDRMVLVQRLLICVVMDALRDYGMFDEADLEREYDNLYAYPPGEEERGKLSVSVATVSPVSGLVHVGLNVTSAGTPVHTVGLAELGIDDIDRFAVEVLRRFVDEVQELSSDVCKVRPV